MNVEAHAAWLPHLAQLVQKRLGLNFPPERWPDLLRGVVAVGRESGEPDIDAIAQTLLRAPLDGMRLEMLANALTVGETYFFRERQTFEVLGEEILPKLIAERRNTVRCLRLWSAGCCTGEEAYSLAILLDRLLPQRTDWRITILATDLNPRFLRTAIRGEYGEWSFRDAPQWLKPRYFTPASNGKFAIDARIRSMVKFAPLNLADLAYPRQENDTQSMDLILCRNVLMYFTPALMRRVVLGLHQALVEGGLLSVSATELGARAFDVLVPVRSGGVVFYRKAGPTASVEESRAVGSPQATPRSQPLQDSATHDDAAHRAPPPNDAESVTPSGVLQLAWEHANAGRLEIALTVVEDALSVAKLDVGAHHLHAAILQELGRYAPARAALKRALYLEPDFVLAHHALGQLALRDERPDEAGRHFGNALSLLARMLPDEIVPRADGMAAGQLKALIETALALERHS